MLKTYLSHPLTSGLDLNDPQTTVVRRRIIKEKKFLREIYQEWYCSIAASVPHGPGAVLELGSGPGFMKEYIPDLLTSELFYCPGVDVVLNGTQLPIADEILRGIVMTDVLHHIPDVRRFFAQASRCVLSGGVIVMIEPWVTTWSRLIYKNFHHEPFEPDAQNWEFPPAGPLTSANGALPWILFERDSEQFRSEFPEWHLKSIKGLMPFQYLVSGGVSMRSLMPGWTRGLWRGIEGLLTPWANSLAMFALIVLEKEPVAERRAI
jgi:SAM-dependent methyltransferase